MNEDLRSTQIDLLVKVKQVSESDVYKAASIAQLSKEEGRTYESIQNSLQVLLKGHWVERVFRGRYRLTSKAEDLLAGIMDTEG